MAQVFISHAGANNAQALALASWLKREGWDHFLDLDGLVPGESWVRALVRESHRCEVVLLLLSKAWQESRHCFAERFVAKGLGKHVIGVLVEPIDESQGTMFDEVQRCDLSGKEDVEVFTVAHATKLPATEVRFPKAGLASLARGLREARHDPMTFQWSATASPYPGLETFDESDAAVFFGRDGDILAAMDTLRRERARDGVQLFVISGDSGVGKSSFLRAGLLPRLRREVEHFIVLPTIRSAQAVITGEGGLLESLQVALREQSGQRVGRQTIVVAIDQADELFAPKGRQDAQQLIAHLDSLPSDTVSVFALMTIRSESLPAIDRNEVLQRLTSTELRLKPIPDWALKEVIEHPAARYSEVADIGLTIDPEVTDALIRDAAGADGLPLLSLTLQLLFDGAREKRRSRIEIEHYTHIGGVQRAVGAAFDAALANPGADPAIPSEPAELTNLLKRVFPLFATVDPETKALRRRAASMSALSKAAPQATALVDRLMGKRLLRSRGAEVEVAHDAVLLHWSNFPGLEDKTDGLAAIEKVHGAATEWHAHKRPKIRLVHTGQERRAVASLLRDKALKNRFVPLDITYLRYCRWRDFWRGTKRYMLGATAILLTLAAGLVACSVSWALRNDLPLGYALLPVKWSIGYARRLGVEHLPPTVELKGGTFVMGCRADRDDIEGAECQQGESIEITVDRPCAMGSREVTFLEYDYYVWSSEPGDSPDGVIPYPKDSGFGRMDRPVINVSWNDAQGYVRWLKKRTGQTWRLPTEREWEYAARGGVANAAFPWGKAKVRGWANCTRCDDEFGGKKTAPVAHYKKPNGFGIYDTAGNVAEWVDDNASEDGTTRVLRGGSWMHDFKDVRTVYRSEALPTHRDSIVGFRVCRNLPYTSGQGQVGGAANEDKP